jgi:hypothetical protein
MHRHQNTYDEEEHNHKNRFISYWRQLAAILLPDSLIVAVFTYTLTGTVTPTLVDYVSHTYETDQWALLPVLSTAIGLALVQPLSRYFILDQNSLSSSSASSSNGDGVSRGVDYRQAGMIATLDLTATSLVTIGLVNVGSATFTVIYSSAAAWTALLSVYRGNLLSRAQIIGVTLVTSGLFVNGVGHVYEDEARSETGLLMFMLSCIALLLGTIFHSVVMVRIDEYTKESKLRALQVASSMGRVQIVILIVWNSLRLGSSGSARMRGVLPMGALVWFLLLSVNQSLHSLAFFHMIGRLGAVGSAVLKGFLALNTFGLAAALFCDRTGAGRSDSCLTPLKTFSMLMVCFGGIIYGIASKRRKELQEKAISELPV